MRLIIASSSVAYPEVLRHVGGVALVAGVDMVVEARVGGAAVVVALVQHHVVHVALAAGGEDRPVADHLKGRKEGRLCRARPLTLFLAQSNEPGAFPATRAA